MTAFSVAPKRLEELLAYCAGFAKQMLEAKGDFYPFGAVIRSDGVFNAVAFDAGVEHPKSEDVFLGLQGVFKKQFASREIIAAAIAVNANIPIKYQPGFPDGIRIGIECAGYSRFFYLPYHISEKSGFTALFGGRLKVAYQDFIPVDVPSFLTAD